MVGRTNTGGGGNGCALTVTAPAGVTVTVSKDGKTKTKVADASGTAVFKGLDSGTWTVSITDGIDTAQNFVTIKADYSTEISFFMSTIHVTYPKGSVCTITDGMTTLTAPDTSGTWACVVHNTGIWTVSADDTIGTKSVEITENGQSINVVLRVKLYVVKNGVEQNGYTFDTQARGGSSLTKTSVEGYLKFSKSTYSAGIRTSKAVDTPNFSTLKCLCYGASNKEILIGISDAVSGTGSYADMKKHVFAYGVIPETATDADNIAEVSVDISTISEESYPIVGNEQNGIEIFLKDMWFE